MKNIQVIDDARNAVYDVFQATDKEFEMIFPVGTDVAFIDEVLGRFEGRERKIIDRVFAEIWKRRVKKADILGLHGTLFYEMEYKKVYYPSRRDEEAINPDGSRLR
jgi:hypothetical protein